MTPAMQSMVLTTIEQTLYELIALRYIHEYTVHPNERGWRILFTTYETQYAIPNLKTYIEFKDPWDLPPDSLVSFIDVSLNQ